MSGTRCNEDDAGSESGGGVNVIFWLLETEEILEGGEVRVQVMGEHGPSLQAGMKLETINLARVSAQ